jgi:hypothetical protein
MGLFLGFLCVGGNGFGGYMGGHVRRGTRGEFCGLGGVRREFYQCGNGEGWGGDGVLLFFGVRVLWGTGF